jgi:Ca-activated chloride channel family protein
MRWPAALALALTLAGAAAGAAGTRAPQSIRGGVDLVSLTVTVTEGPRYVTDLDAQDFEVFEDGVRQQPTLFSRLQQPVALAILLDTSASMEGKLETAQEAAIGFARRMRPGDVMEVIDFNGQVNILQTFTGDAAALERAIRQATVNGSTSLYNAVYISLKDLRKARARGTEELRREAIVVLSDGDDTSSLVGYEEVLDVAKRSETAIYAIGLRQHDGPRRAFKEAEFVLRQLSQETGGRVFYPNSVTELPAIYDQIAQELASQYSIGYISKNTQRNGAWRRLTIRVARAGMLARTRQGYYAPGSAPASR